MGLSVKLRATLSHWRLSLSYLSLSLGDYWFCRKRATERDVSAMKKKKKKGAFGFFIYCVYVVLLLLRLCVCVVASIALSAWAVHTHTPGQGILRRRLRFFRFFVENVFYDVYALYSLYANCVCWRCIYRVWCSRFHLFNSRLCVSRSSIERFFYRICMCVLLSSSSLLQMRSYIGLRDRKSRVCVCVFSVRFLWRNPIRWHALVSWRIERKCSGATRVSRRKK